MSWNEAVFWPAFEAAGMLVDAQVLFAGTDVPIAAKVSFCAPTVNPMTGVQSYDYEVEYQHADWPELDEADQVIVEGGVYQGLYRVRQAPRTEGLEATGFFRKALLTKVAPAC